MKTAIRSLLLASLACAALAAFSLAATAAPGDLDFTFSGTGKVTTALGSGTDNGNSVAIQSDAKIVVAGSSFNGTNPDIALVRYNINGSLDTTFNGTGKVTTDIGGRESVANSIAIQSDAKIVVAGSSFNGTNTDFAVVRYNANGTLDTTFNGTGKVTTAVGDDDSAQGVAVQPDGKIVVAGSSSSKFALVRYNANGTLDTSFGGSGIVTTTIGVSSHGSSVAIQPDGKIVVAGDSSPGGAFNFALVRYNANGSLDTTFNGTGKVTTDIGGSTDHGVSVTIQSDEKIVVAGASYQVAAGNMDFALARYNSDGSLDTTFNGTGKVTTAVGGSDDFARSLAVKNDGKIIVAGSSFNSNDDLALVRYNANGTLDTTFNGTGKVTTAVGDGGDYGYSVAIQSDGKFVVAGVSYNGSNNDLAVARYEGDYPDTDGDGIPDEYETGTGIYVSPTNTGTSPTNSDTDGDGLTDGQEVNTYHSNPNLADTDGDGFSDGFEVSTGFDPTSPASTPEALSAIYAAVEYRFNAANGISYRIEASTDLQNWSTIETPIIGAGVAVVRFYSTVGQPKRFFRSRRN